MGEIKKLFLETDVDKLMELVKKKKRLSIRDAAVALGEAEDIVSDWVKILEARGYLKISYPIAGAPFMEMGEKKNSDSEDSEEKPDELEEESIGETEKEIAPERKQTKKNKKHSKSHKIKKAPKKTKKKMKKKGRR